jgi:hypothetical protein
MIRTACLAVCMTVSTAFAAQVATSVDQVKRIYVGSFGNKGDSAKLRESLIAELGKHSHLMVVNSPEQADAVLDGSGEVWVKGYYSLNPRVREVGEGALPIYGGFLSVELTGKQETPLWSWLATPQRSASRDINHELAAQIVRKLDDRVLAAARHP